MHDLPLLMIPGPIELSPRVSAATPSRPPSHVSESIIDDFGSALRRMRSVWMASPAAQPFVVGGSGTLAMEMAVYNVIDPGDAVLVVNTGYFSVRMKDMLERAGAEVKVLGNPLDGPVSAEALDEEMSQGPCKALFATHVDTSTGIRIEPKSYCQVAQKWDVLTIFDGVCATAAERFEMASWGADVYLTASQKAIGLPAGLGLMVVSERALRGRKMSTSSPPMVLDWEQWLPVMQAYEEGRASYFSTPPTTLIPPLRVALEELVPPEDDAVEAMRTVFMRHQVCADALRQIWELWALKLLAPDADCAANTLSTLRYPAGVGPELLTEMKRRGVIVAGGLFPGLKQNTFRIGHMGYAVSQNEMMHRLIHTLAESLTGLGHTVSGLEAIAIWEGRFSAR